MNVLPRRIEVSAECHLQKCKATVCHCHTDLSRGEGEGEGRRWGEKGGRGGEVDSYFILLFQIV